MKVYLGIDWSQSKHDLVFLNGAGAIVAYETISHTLEGFHELDRARQSLGVAPSACPVALETAHNLLIDYLWLHGYEQVYVVPPAVTRASQKRYRQSGARTDESDAFLLADLLRTSRHQLHPWRPDSLLTRSIRAQVRLIDGLTRTSVSLCNRLRSLLTRYHPAPLQAFGSLQTQFALTFIHAYPTPESVQNLTLPELRSFARAQQYTRRSYLPKLFARLQGSLPPVEEATSQIFAGHAPVLANLLKETLQAKKQALRDLCYLFEQHPDREIYQSLPGAGEYLAPALLTKLGDDRERFPNAASVQSLAGTCPVTERSGKRRVVMFRRACDRSFRHIAVQWARHSLRSSAWANGYWQRVRPRSQSTSHAYRCLANRWLAVLWKLWQTGQPYDEEYHLQQCAAHRMPA